MRSAFIPIVTALSATVLSQSLSELPQCAQSCVGSSLASLGCGTLNIQCICSQSSWINELSCCISQTCSPQDQQTTITFAQQLCATNGVTLPSVASCASSSNPTTSVVTSSNPSSTSSTTSTTNVISSSSSSSTSSSSYSWNGIGALLTGTCATPDYTILSAVPTAGIWVQVVGCVNERPDCCPYSINGGGVQTTTATTVVTSIITVNAGPSGTQTVTGGPGAFPGAALASQATLDRCPEDYASVSGGCCPSGYDLWNAALGGQTPCFSTLSTISSTLTAPPIPSSELASAASAANVSPASAYSVSTVLSIVYAMYYPVAPRTAQLSPGAKAGIGTGSAVAGLAIGALGFLLLWQRRRHRKELESQKGTSEGNRASAVGEWVNDSSTVAGSTWQHMVGSDVVYEGPAPGPVSSWNERNDGRPFSVPRRPLAQPHNPYPSPSELPGQQHSPRPYQQYSVSPTMSSMEGQVDVVPDNAYPPQPGTAPAPPPQELHNPHWAGRYELPGAGAQQGVGVMGYPASMPPTGPSQYQYRQ